MYTQCYYGALQPHTLFRWRRLNKVNTSSFVLVPPGLFGLSNEWNRCPKKHAHMEPRGIMLEYPGPLWIACPSCSAHVTPPRQVCHLSFLSPHFFFSVTPTPHPTPIPLPTAQRTGPAELLHACDRASVEPQCHVLQPGRDVLGLPGLGGGRRLPERQRDAVPPPGVPPQERAVRRGSAAPPQHRQCRSVSSLGLSLGLTQLVLNDEWRTAIFYYHVKSVQKIPK